MAGSAKPVLLQVALIVMLVFGAISGVALLLAPEAYAAFTQATVPDMARVRWPGGMLIALAVGAWRVLRSPARQGAFVLTLALAMLLVGLSLLFSLVTHEFTGRAATMTAACISTLVESGLLFLGWRSARALLN